MREPSSCFFLAAAAAALLAGCGARASTRPADGDGAVPVRTAPVERGPVRHPVRATGTVAAKSEYDLAFRIGGILARVAVDAGAAVRKGQVLATLDATDVAAAVRQSREGLAKAQRDLERARIMRAGDAISPAAAQDAETVAAVAEAALRGAEFNLRHTTLVAPDDGWVDRRLAEPGEVVAAGRPVLHLSGRGRGWVVRVAVPERDVIGLAPGQAAAVRLDARPDQAIPGRISEVAPSATRGTGTYQAEIRLDPDRAGIPVLAGLTARVEIEREVTAQGAVPLSAVLEGDGASGVVYVVEGDRARRVPVRLAFLQGDRAVVAAGLDGVECVVTDGAYRIADGTRVHLAP
jgi:membrane fusion protein, multidrug efflux system